MMLWPEAGTAKLIARAIAAAAYRHNKRFLMRVPRMMAKLPREGHRPYMSVLHETAIEMGQSQRGAADIPALAPRAGTALQQISPLCPRHQGIWAFRISGRPLLGFTGLQFASAPLRLDRYGLGP